MLPCPLNSAEVPAIAKSKTGTVSIPWAKEEGAIYKLKWRVLSPVPVETCTFQMVMVDKSINAFLLAKCSELIITILYIKKKSNTGISYSTKQ